MRDRHEQLREDYMMTFSTPQGRRVLGDLERKFGFTSKPIFDPDPQTLAHRAGAHDAVVYIAMMMAQIEQPKHGET